MGNKIEKTEKVFKKELKPPTLILLVEYFFFNCSSQATRKKSLKIVSQFHLCTQKNSEYTSRSHICLQNLVSGLVDSVR